MRHRGGLDCGMSSEQTSREADGAVVGAAGRASKASRKGRALLGAAAILYWGAGMLSGAGGVAVVGSLGGCSGGYSQLSGDSAADLKNPKYRWQLRGEALDKLWEESGSSAEARTRTRMLLKDMLWDAEHTPTELRVKIMEKLLSDTDEANLADSRAMARLMMPKEVSRGLLVYVCSVVGARGWVDFTGPLIRSYARPQVLVPDKERCERGALEALYPGQSVEQTVYNAFVHPPPMDPIPGMDPTARLRTDAWDLLGRLDSSGAFRLQALKETGVPADDQVLTSIQRSARELRAIPISGGEISWLLSLTSEENTENAAWWGEAMSAVSRLSMEQYLGLCLRHVEAVRWASANRPQWMGMSRDGLLKELKNRLDRRTTHKRSADQQANRKPARQDLESWEGKLLWGDLLTLLVLDDALAESKLRAQLIQQQRLDYEDKQTEYGGVLDFGGGTAEKSWSGEEKTSPPAWRARLYPPRSAQRFADDRFIASNDMMAAADRALAIYHFHTQRYRNDEYAGPSDGDIEFAASSGRSCVVFTSIREGTVNADYYQPNGVVIDLGELKVP